MPVADDASDLEAVRSATASLVRAAAETTRPTLIEAPPASGKTTTAFELARDLSVPITYLAGRRDLYAQAEAWAAEHDDLVAAIIPSPHRDCPTFTGEAGNPAQVRRLYAKGYSGAELHYWPRAEAYTPCVDDGCPYLEAWERIDQGVEEIDLLIGHHQHCNRAQYVRDRIVVIDEFNPDPFLQRFPDERSTVIDDPGAIVPAFLEAVKDADEGFPAVDDLADLREIGDADRRAAALAWLRKHGASRSAAEDFDFLSPTEHRYDATHLRAPLLVLGLLCMEKVGPGVEVAPPPDGDRDAVWTDAGLGAGTQCFRDRNTGEMVTLVPPDLSEARQVIGLDALPTPELWDLLYAPEEGFEHRQVIERPALSTYLTDAMDMSLTQLGGGTHHYADGQVSDFDQYRFATVRWREGRRFPLVSTRKAIQAYERRGWLDEYVARTADTEDAMVVDGVAARHFALIRSSNAFEREDLGVVAGTPFPKDDVVRLWAGFCGEAVAPEGRGEDKTFGTFGDRIYRHFADHQVLQAICRFGRHESVYQDGGASVYVSTFQVPDWFEIPRTIDVRSNTKENRVIQLLIATDRDADREPETYASVPMLVEEAEDVPGGPISSDHVGAVLEELVEQELATVRPDTGRNGADVYRWTGDERLVTVDGRTTLAVGHDRVYVLDAGESPRQ